MATDIDGLIFPEMKNKKVTIGYQASHEQFPPTQLLRLVQKAEKAGFQMINSSDHLIPWSKKQGHSGFAWSWLGAVMSKTTIPFSVVSAPGYRYHPVVLAQATATLCEMFPRRLQLIVGSGEEMNEHITGEKWPEKSLRNKRLKECVAIMRKLFNGKEVSHYGEIKVEQAKIYSLPSYQPKIFGAAITPETAEFLSEFTDGLITIQQKGNKHHEVIKAFRKKAKNKPVWLKSQVSFDKTYEKALTGAHEQWRNNVMDSAVLFRLTTVAQFDAAGKFIDPEEVVEHVRISSDIKKHIEWIKQDIAMGFDTIVLHNVNRNQDFFLEEFGKKVLPAFR